jgi:hypothetical protein
LTQAILDSPNGAGEKDALFGKTIEPVEHLVSQFVGLRPLELAAAHLLNDPTKADLQGASYARVTLGIHGLPSLQVLKDGGSALKSGRSCAIRCTIFKVFKFAAGFTPVRHFFGC